jgi:hypothetical protein
MRTVSAANHVVRLVAELCEERGVTTLTDEQSEAVRTAVERVYGVPLDLPTPEDIDEWKSRLARPRK